MASRASTSGRAAPAGRATGPDRPPSSGRAASRPKPAPLTPAAGTMLAGGTGAARGLGAFGRPVTMLSAVLVALVLLLAPYVRPWVDQRSQIAAADQQMRALRQQVADLSEQRRRWNDPAYVRAQARERLKYVLPGETGYVVLDEKAPAPAAADPRSAAAVLPSTTSDAAGRDDSPWYAKIWTSVGRAGASDTSEVTR